MAIEHVSTGALAEAAATSVTVTLPTHTTDDLIVVFGGAREDSPVPSLAVSGYTAIGSQAFLDLGSNGIALHAWYKFATSGAESNPSITGGGSATGGTFGFAVVYRGVDTTTPLSGVTPLQGTSAAADQFTPPSITPDSASARLVVSAVATADDNALAIVTSQSFTTRASGASYDTTTGLNIAFAQTDKAVTQSTAVTLPTYDQTVVGTDAWAYKTFVLRPTPNATVTASTVAGTTTVGAVNIQPVQAATVAAVTTIGAPRLFGAIVKSSASANAGTTSTDAFSITLPAGINDGDVAYMVVAMNTQLDRGDPSGWELVDFSVSSTVLQQKVYRKTLSASESSTNVTFTLSNVQRWSAVLAVVQNDGGIDVEDTPLVVTSSSAVWTADEVTPTVNNDLLLVFNSWRTNQAGTTASTAPTGWTEIADTSLNADVPPTIGAAISQQELVGGSGVGTGADTDGAYSPGSTHNITQVLAIKPPQTSPNATVTASVVAAATAIPTVGGSTQNVAVVGRLVEETCDDTDNTTASTGNTVFDVFNGSGTSTFQDTPTPISGATCLAFDGTGVGNQRTAKDTSTLPGATNGGNVLRRLYWRGYARLSATPSALSRMVVFEQSVAAGGADVGGIRFNADGSLRLMDGSSTTGTVFTRGLSTTEWTRIELELNQDANTIVGRAWWGADLHSASTGATNYETQSGTITSDFDAEVWGVGVYATNTDTILYLDEIVVGGGDWVGPASVSGNATITATTVAAATSISGSAFTPVPAVTVAAATTVSGSVVTPVPAVTVAATTTISGKPYTPVPAVTVAATTTISGKPYTPVPAVTVAATTTVGAPTFPALEAAATVAAVTTVGTPTFTSSATVTAATVAGSTTISGTPFTPVPAVTVAAVTTVGAPTFPAREEAATVAGTTTVGAPTILVGSTVTAATVAGVTTVGAPSFPAREEAATVAATTTVGAPTVQASSTVAAATVAGVTTVGTVAVQTSSNATAAPATVAGATTVGAPTLITNSTFTVTTVAGATTVGAPTFPALEAAATVAATATVGAPTVTTGSTASPAVVAATATVGSPTFPALESAATVAATTTVGAPTIITNSTVPVTTVSGVATVGTTTLLTSVTVTGTTVGGVATVGTPTFTSNATVAGTTVAGVAAVGAPTVQASSTVAGATVAGVTTVGAPRIQPSQAGTVNATTTVGTVTVQAQTNATVSATTVAGSSTVTGTPFTPVPAVTVAGSTSFAVVNGAPGMAVVGLLIEETCEDTDNTTVSGANSVFDLINGAGGATFQDTPTPVKGTTVIDVDGTGGLKVLKNTTRLPGSTNGGAVLRKLYARFYSRLSANPSGPSRFFGFETDVESVGIDVAFLRTNATRVIQLMDGTTYTGVATTRLLSTTEWTRVEFSMNQDTNTMEVRLWWGDDLHNPSTSATNYESKTATLTSNDDVEVIGIGLHANVGIHHYLDEIAIGGGDWIGPVELSNAATPNTVAATTTISGSAFTPPPAATVAATTTIGAPTILTGSTVMAATVDGTTTVGTALIQPSQAGTVAAVTTVGAPTVQASITVTAVTVAAVATVGTPTFTSSATVPAVTVNATTTVGTPTFTSDAAVAAVTVAATTTVGTALVTPAQTGTVNAVATVGAPSIQTQGNVSIAAVTVNGTTTIAGTAQVGSTLTPAVVAAVTTIGAPTVTTGSAPSPTTVAGVATVGAPTLQTGSTVSAATVAGAATVAQPGLATRPETGTVAATTTVGSPTVTTDSVIPAATVSLSSTVDTPTVVTTGNATVTPSTVAATASIGAPTVQAGSTVPVSTVAAATTVGAPAFTSSATASTATVGVVASVPAPTVDAASSATATPGTVAAVTAVGGAAPRTGSTVTGATVTAVTAVGTPTFTSSATAAPATVGATTSVGAPTVLTSSLVPSATVPATATVSSPTVLTVTAATPTTVHATTTVGVPVFTSSATVTPSTVAGSTTISGTAVTESTITPATVAATTTVGTPTITLGAGSAPATVHGTALIGATTLLVGSTLAPATVSGLCTIGAPHVRGHKRRGNPWHSRVTGGGHDSAATTTSLGTSGTNRSVTTSASERLPLRTRQGSGSNESEVDT